VALVCVLGFLLVSARHLDSLPQVYEDEPWQASTAYALLQRGTFGSDLFAGFHNMQARYYGFLPAHPLLLSLVFRLFGLGLVQARLETVGLGLLILVLTFSIGRRLFGAWVGALALLALVFVRWSGLTYVQLTGIPLVDLSRIARYDPLAAALGLAALLVYLNVRQSGTRLGYLGAGVLAGLSGLAHLYGLFWVIVLVVLVVMDRRQRAPAGWIVLGAVLPWLPYAAYVAGDLPDWRGQTAGYANRFDLLNPAWYLDNLAQEYHRYGPGLGPPGLGMLLRVGFWSLLVALPLSLGALAWRAWRCGDAAARAVVVPAILLPILFAALIHLKLVNYTLLELPLEALAVAWGVVAAWRWLARRPRWRHARVALLALLLAVYAEGALQLARLEAQAAVTTPYAVFAQRVRQYVPGGAHVLGLHTYWFGFEDLEYRSFLVPLLLADEGLPLDQALDRMAADTLLLDDRLRTYFGPAGDASAADRARFESWLQRHQAQLLGSVDDQTYGRMEVYRLS
jgi:4-amino-4-deoxy-L-arabinose transferase-like glycosyltransferase